MAWSTFEARFPGRCADCPEPIEPGDEVVYAGDRLVHADCGRATADAPPPPPPAGEVCQDCWQTRSVSGECACGT